LIVFLFHNLFKLYYKKIPYENASYLNNMELALTANPNPTSPHEDSLNPNP
jgi:hypothetical protein